jgi:hypothetical protein
MTFRRAVAAGGLALGSKTVALGAKGGGVFKGLTGLAFVGGGAAALATSTTDSDDTKKVPVAVADEQKLPNVALAQQQDKNRLSPRR